jgi:hypothetical protein
LAVNLNEDPVFAGVRMTTTYVFGAGASRDVGYPLASDMGDGLLDFMLNSQNTLIRASGELLVDTFGKSSNIEDLMTELQSRIASLKDSQAPADRVQRMRLGRSSGFLGAALREWFREIHTRPSPSYEMFADKIAKAGDVIITFNYDDSLDRQLKRVEKWDISRGYGFPLGPTDESSDVLILKLHGSINWLVSILDGATGGTFVVNPESTLGNHPVIHQTDLEFLGYEQFSGLTYQSGGAFPCLILPGREKEFFYDTSLGREYSAFWDHLWSQAAEAVKRSSSIVLCGYSLLPVDQRACELLLEQPRKETRIEIVSGSQTDRIANDFKGAGFSNVQAFKDGYFENWCKLHSQ